MSPTKGPVMPSVAFDPAGEFDRQVRTLVDKGYPAMAGLTEEAFAALAASSRESVLARVGAMEPPDEGRVPFFLVTTRRLVPIERSVPLTALEGMSKPGVVDRHYASGDLDRFTATKDLDVPAAPLYVLFGADRGEEFRGVVPDDAVAAITARGRTPLTLEEGIAFITHHPRALAKNRCFSLGGSRCGDRRVPAVWISQGAPKLGWCWAGNPHTWLGMASAADRTG